MAANVFGIPVTDDTVKIMYPELQGPITANQRAEVALLYRTAENKHVLVNQYVHNLKDRYGTGTSTLCMVYNATGGTVDFSRVHNWEGEVWGSPAPSVIQNGQWAGFLHVRGRLAGPSKAAVVYSGKNNAGDGRDWMLAWNTSRMNYANRVYTEIRAKNHFNTDRWSYISGLMDRQSTSHIDTWGGCRSVIAVGGGSSPALEATMTLDGLSVRFVEIADAIASSEGLDSTTVDDAGDDVGTAE